ncbi:predicted protein, partial [Postia placenta Mad-698-R]
MERAPSGAQRPCDHRAETDQGGQLSGRGVRASGTAILRRGLCDKCHSAAAAKNEASRGLPTCGNRRARTNAGRSSVSGMRDGADAVESATYEGSQRGDGPRRLADQAGVRTWWRAERGGRRAEGQRAAVRSRSAFVAAVDTLTWTRDAGLGHVARTGNCACLCAMCLRLDPEFISSDEDGPQRALASDCAMKTLTGRAHAPLDIVGNVSARGRECVGVREVFDLAFASGAEAVGGEMAGLLECAEPQREGECSLNEPKEEGEATLDLATVTAAAGLGRATTCDARPRSPSRGRRRGLIGALHMDLIGALHMDHWMYHAIQRGDIECAARDSRAPSSRPSHVSVDASERGTPARAPTALVIILAAVCYARTLCCLSSRQPAAKAGHRQAVSGLPGTGATWSLPRPDAHPDVLNCWLFSDTAPQTNGCAYYGRPHGAP